MLQRSSFSIRFLILRLRGQDGSGRSVEPWRGVEHERAERAQRLPELVRVGYNALRTVSAYREYRLAGVAERYTRQSQKLLPFTGLWVRIPPPAPFLFPPLHLQRTNSRVVLLDATFLCSFERISPIEYAFGGITAWKQTLGCAHAVAR
jgi:hypothetical protein